MPTMTSRKSHTDGAGPGAVNGTGMRIDDHLMAKARRAGYHLHEAGYATPERVEALSNAELEAVPHCAGRMLKVIRFAVATRNPVVLPALFPDERAVRVWRAKSEGGRRIWAGRSKEERREALRARGVLWTSETARQAKAGAAPAPPSAPESVAAEAAVETVEAATLDPVGTPPLPAFRVVDLVQVARDLVAAEDAVGTAERGLSEEERQHAETLAALERVHERAVSDLRAAIERARQDRDAAVALLAEAARSVHAGAA